MFSIFQHSHKLLTKSVNAGKVEVKLNEKFTTVKLGQVGLASNITHNHSHKL